MQTLAPNGQPLDPAAIDRDFLPQERLDIRDRARTSLYPWRGQFSPGLVELLLEAHADSHTRVLDPFVGSGTTLFEASRRQLPCVGVEINPAAVQLAGMARFASIDMSTRVSIALEATQRVNEMLARFHRDSALAQGMVQLLGEVREQDLLHNFLAATVMLAMGDGATLAVPALEKALGQNRATIFSLPHSAQHCEIFLGDARCLPLAKSSIDLVLTSPPYINVFNYHQNYRKAMELMGWQPLQIAVAEIGANRKHRGNRFLTVVQYCMDLAQHFVELHRVLSADGMALYVVGRESRVRNVAFNNGRMLCEVAVGAAGFRLLRWQVRKFTNRFGETIFEDILTLRPENAMAESPEEVGRQIGITALKSALPRADEAALADIQQAIERSAKITPSPLLPEHREVHRYPAGAQSIAREK